MIKDNETVDDLQLNNLKIIQKDTGFRFGIDAVLLSHFAMCSKKANVLDIGTGTGIIPILMYGKNKGDRFTGIDIQEEMVDMANRSAKLNGISENVNFVHCDVKNVKNIFKPNTFDCLVSNPPYMKVGNGLLNPDPKKAMSRHELSCNIYDIFEACRYLLKDKGKVFMIHRPHRLPDIIDAMKINKIEPKILRFVSPYVDKEPNLVLICGVKFGKKELKIQKHLFVYEKNNEYTDEVKKIYGIDINKSL